MQTPVKALEQARVRVLRGFSKGYPVDSVAAFIDVGPDVDARLWAWWMTLHGPDQPKDTRGFRHYYERVYEELENLWPRRR